jgi:NAD(P)-dependent dehydrogenase (short-subunit alcohol dehydrogenase family)
MNGPLDVDLSDRIALVTGASSGMGRETARELARMGGEVLLGCRDEQRGQAAVDDIVRTTGNARVSVITIDLASLASVRAGASAVLQRCGRLDILVNNAAASLRARQVTEDGFERHWATNVLGPYALTTLLLPALQASGHGRIVNVSTVAAGGLRLDDTQYAQRRFTGTGAYRASKQAARMLAWSLAEQTSASLVTVNCVNPGYVVTDLTLSAGPLVRLLVALTKFRAQTALEGADTAIWAAASEDVAGMTGRFWGRRHELTCRFRDPAARARLTALVERQLQATPAAAGAAVPQQRQASPRQPTDRG